MKILAIGAAGRTRRQVLARFPRLGRRGAENIDGAHGVDIVAPAPFPSDGEAYDTVASQSPPKLVSRRKRVIFARASVVADSDFGEVFRAPIEDEHVGAIA